MDLADQCDAAEIGGGSLAYNQATKTVAATSTAAIDQSAASHSLNRTWSVSIVETRLRRVKRRSLILVPIERPAKQRDRIRAVLFESSYRKVGLSRTESSAFVELVLEDWETSETG